MPDPADHTEPPKSARPRRSRKFVLPDHHHDEDRDERTAGHIEAFLDGPVASPKRRPAAEARLRRPIELITRQDWVAAVRYEGARHARYGRSVSVLVIEIRGAAEEVARDRIARALTDVLRAEARETDRAMRAGALSFRVLLPETDGRAARTLVERIDRAFGATSDGKVAGIDLCVEVGTASQTGSLEDVLADAERRVAVVA